MNLTRFFTYELYKNLNLEQHLQIIKTELVGSGSLAPCQHVVGKVELLLLELEDPLLHRPLHHEPEANRIS